MLFVAWCCCRPVAAQQYSWCPQLQGYVKDMQTVAFVDDVASLSSLNLIHNRLNFHWDIAPGVTARLETRNRLLYGDQMKLMPDFGKRIGADDGLVNLTKLWVNDQNLVFTSALDRALLKYNGKRTVVTLGRQRINWGVNTIWNPIDIFNAYNFLDFDYEERPGVDAVRLEYYPSGFSSVEIACAGGNRGRKYTTAAMFRLNRWKYDFQWLGGWSEKELIGGMAWAGNIRQAGFKGEASFFKKRAAWRLERDVFTFSLMADYAFKSSVYVSGSLLYINAPSKVQRFVQTSDAMSVTARNLMPFRWSFYTGLQKQFSPAFSAAFSLVYAPEKNSVILFPVLRYALTEDVETDLTLQSFLGQEAKLYRAAWNSIYLRFRWSF